MYAIHATRGSHPQLIFNYELYDFFIIMLMLNPYCIITFLCSTVTVIYHKKASARLFWWLFRLENKYVWFCSELWGLKNVCGNIRYTNTVRYVWLLDNSDITNKSNNSFPDWKSYQDIMKKQITIMYFWILILKQCSFWSL